MSCSFPSQPASAQEHADQGAVTQGTTTVDQVEEEAPTITLSDDKLQLIGVRTEAAVFHKLDKQIRTVGKVEVNETRLAFVNTKIAGWVKKLYVNFTGDRVVEGQPLLSIYSPDLVTAQEEYLLALRSRPRFPEALRRSGSPAIVDRFREARLILWDITEARSRRSKRRGSQDRYDHQCAAQRHRARQDGARRSLYHAGMNLYKIADLSPVWIMADVYEYEVPLVKLGQRARVTLPYSSGEVLHATVNFIYPVLDPLTRTVKVRIARAESRACSQAGHVRECGDHDLHPRRGSSSPGER